MTLLHRLKEKNAENRKEIGCLPFTTENILRKAAEFRFEVYSFHCTEAPAVVVLEHTKDNEGDITKLITPFFENELSVIITETTSTRLPEYLKRIAQIHLCRESAIRSSYSMKPTREEIIAQNASWILIDHDGLQHIARELNIGDQGAYPHIILTYSKNLKPI